MEPAKVRGGGFTFVWNGSKTVNIWHRGINFDCWTYSETPTREQAIADMKSAANDHQRCGEWFDNLWNLEVVYRNR